MKNLTVISFCSILVLSAAVFPSCAAQAPAKRDEAPESDSGAVFKDIEGKEWQLSEIRNDGKTVIIDRKKYETNYMGAFFTINFQDNSVSGTGAPNRYFGPCTPGSYNSLVIGNLASTMMAAFMEPEELKEGEYFGYLSNVRRWNFFDGKLELYSTNNNDREAILVFILK